MNWAVAVIVFIIVGFLLDREIYFYEGAHLGPRLQSWLYDRWSKKYDAGKRESQLHDDEMLAEPLLEKLNDIPEPFILDFATGTGRLSYALLSRGDFHGHIIALDISQGMLEQALSKLKGAHLHDLLSKSRAAQVSSAGQESTVPPLPKGHDVSARVEFLRHQSMPLPFPDAAFDAVCCLEVLELLPDTQAALNEMSRLLRPGGTLLTSRGTEESGRRAKVKSKERLTSILQASGFENILITKWWKLFDRVLGNKKGTSPPVGKKSLMDVLRCSSCGQIDWQESAHGLRCSNCNHELPVTERGIVLN